MATQSFPTPAATDPSSLVLLSHLVDRTDAVRANFSGSTEPASTVAYQMWADTTTGMMRVRNSTNTAWVDVHALGFAAKQTHPMQAAGALGAKELQMSVPNGATVARLAIVPDTSTTSSSAGVTDWQFMLRNVTQSVDLFSAAPGTATDVDGIGGGEMVADALYPLTADQNQSVDAGDVLRLTVTVNGSPTAVPDLSIALEFTPAGA